jgi:hypothetical protein
MSQSRARFARAKRSANVAAVGIAPAEAIGRGHLEDHRVVFGQRMGSCISALGFTAADMTAGGAQAQV